METILDCISVLGETTAGLKRGLDKKIETETALLRLCTPSLSGDINAVLRRISDLENKIASGVAVVSRSVPAPAAPETPKKEKAEEETSPDQTTPPEVSNTENASLCKFWPEIVSELKHTIPAISSFLTGSSAYVRGSSLFIQSDNPVLFKFLSMPNYKTQVQKAVDRFSGNSLQVRLDMKEDSKTKKDPLQDLIRQIHEIQ